MACQYKIQETFDEVVWDEFVRSHPKGNVFQGPQFANAHKNGRFTDVLSLFATKDNVLIGVMVGILHKSGLGYISSRIIVTGGPLVAVSESQALNDLLEAFSAKARKLALLTQIRNLTEWADEEKRIAQGCGYNYSEHLDVKVDLHRSESKIWSDVHRHRRRNVRKAEKKLKVIKAGEEDLKTTYGIFKRNYKHYKKSIIGENVFYNLCKSLGSTNRFIIFAVLNENQKIIGSMYALAFNDTVYCWYACSLSEYYKLYPNDLLHWYAMMWAKDNGYRVFDFGGAGMPGIPYGVRDFKQQYGGIITEFGRFTIVHNKLLYSIAESCYSLIMKFRSLI